MSGNKESNIRTVLEAIPDDSWVKASDIEKKTDLSVHEIGGIISQNLLHVFVERRKTSINGGAFYEYRRFRRLIRDNGRLERAWEHEPTRQGGLLSPHEALGKNQAKTPRS
ncbi:MAG TPA: hypothetical protein VMW50_13415 [Dehalococcoidia bacterium]|nr:hypothetical protein [Dehalococcoidia bacterium]